MTRFGLLISLFTFQLIANAQISSDSSAKILLDEVSAAKEQLLLFNILICELHVLFHVEITGTWLCDQHIIQFQ